MDKQMDAKFRKQFFIYVVKQSIVGNGTATPTLSIDDNDFVVEEIARSRDGAFAVKVSGTNDDRNWTSDYVIDDVFFGCAYATSGSNEQKPYKIPVPKYLRSRTVLTFDLRNDTGSTNDVEIYLIGYKKIPIA